MPVENYFRLFCFCCPVVSDHDNCNLFSLAHRSTSCLCSPSSQVQVYIHKFPHCQNTVQLHCNNNICQLWPKPSWKKTVTFASGSWQEYSEETEGEGEIGGEQFRQPQLPFLLEVIIVACVWVYAHLIACMLVFGVTEIYTVWLLGPTWIWGPICFW